MIATVVILPRDLKPNDVHGKTVIVFDVLRATTTMTAALDAGVAEIRIFDSPGAAMEASRGFPGAKLVCGEVNSLPPPGFDLGNSPGDFRRDLHAGRTLFMSTTNGTRAIVAAREAEQMFIGALVNASAVGRAAVAAGNDLTLLCSGTQGDVSIEDLLGAGAVLDSILTSPSRQSPSLQLVGDVAYTALRLYRNAREHLADVLHEGHGGHNVVRAGLTPDIAFAATLNKYALVGQVHRDPTLAVRLCENKNN